MPDLPSSLARDPVLKKWIRINEDNSVTVATGKVELGQGILTAITAIAAEELYMSVAQIHVATVDTRRSPNEMITAGSMSVETSGLAVRVVCAEAVSLMLKSAGERLQEPLAALYLEDGTVRSRESNQSLAYRELNTEVLFDVVVSGDAPLKKTDDYKIVGRRQQRIDLRAKISGGNPFIQDKPSTSLPLLHARIIRPPRFHDELISRPQDATISAHIHSVVQDGNFLGVLATEEFVAIQAQEQLNLTCKWRSRSEPIPGDIPHFLRNNVSASLLLEGGTPTDNPVPDLISIADTTAISAAYTKPYHMHASLGPSAARAWLLNEELFVESHTQGPYILKMVLAQSLDMPVEQVHVIHRENAGCYGHNGADDAAMDAALLAIHEPGHEILVKWSRQDECRWEPYSPAMVMDLNASIKDGKIMCWNGDIYSQSHGGRPIPFGSVSNLITAWQKSDPQPRAESRPGRGTHSGIHRNADPYYSFPQRRITKNLVASQVVRTSSTRGLGAFGNIFAIESFMDELALAADMDPVTFRLNHLNDQRAANVINTAWNSSLTHVLPANTETEVFGRGLGFARYKNIQCYAAVAVQLKVNNDTAEVMLIRADIAADAGQIIDSDGIANQLEGGFIQAASWTLKEAVQLSHQGSDSIDWDSYPILRFNEVPEVQVHLLDHPDMPCLGSGEATQGPTPAAIANALFDATGLRLRDIPFTPERLRQTAVQN